MLLFLHVCLALGLAVAVAVEVRTRIATGAPLVDTSLIVLQGSLALVATFLGGLALRVEVLRRVEQVVIVVAAAAGAAVAIAASASVGVVFAVLGAVLGLSLLRDPSVRAAYAERKGDRIQRSALVGWTALRGVIVCAGGVTAALVPFLVLADSGGRGVRAVPGIEIALCLVASLVLGLAGALGVRAALGAVEARVRALAPSSP